MPEAMKRFLVERLVRLHGTESEVGKQERLDWICAAIAEKPCGGDILDAEFIDQYTAATGAKFKKTNFGAHKCPQLGRDLSLLAKEGRLTRFRIGLKGSWQPGFPTWIWSYEIPCGNDHAT